MAAGFRRHAGGALGASPSFKEFVMKKYGRLLAALVLLFAGCSNPVDGLLSYNDIYDRDEEEYIDRSGVAAGIAFADAGLVGNTIPAADGEGTRTVAGTITFPATDGPWAAELVSGQGSGNNRLFEIKHVNDSSEEDETAPTKAHLVIKEGATLEWGHYSVRVKIHNGDGGLSFVKVFSFEVTLCPPLFKDAPGVYPSVANGANKLTIRWPKRQSATSYTVYVGKSDNFSAASPLIGTYTTGGTPDYRGWTESVEMTKFPGEQTALPDNTAYWVWVTATNSSGTTPPSPAARKKTTLPVQEFFHEANGEEKVPLFYMADSYQFTETTVQYGFPGPEAGLFDYCGDIVYHELFDGGTETSNAPFPDKGKFDEDCIGKPAGVFVIKYQEGKKPGTLKGNNDPLGNKWYSAVYYWGMGTIKPSTGKIQSYIVNQWNAYAETATIEEALDKFTCANIKTYLKMGPEPYEKTFPD
jgi:hypothetical protein